MKTKFKKSNKIISLMLALVMVVSLLPMNILMATAAPAETSELPTSYTGWKPTFATYTEGLTQYFKYGGYLYKAVWKNCNATSVVLYKNSSDALQYRRNGSAWSINLCKGSTGNSNKITVYQLPKTVNGVLVAYGSSSTDVKNTSSHILEITCVGVKAPTWTWSDDKTSATAVFVSEDGKAQVTIGATVTSGTEAAENCQEKDKIIYTASATFNGTAYSDAKTEDGAAGNHIGGEATCSAKAVCEACGEEYGSPDPDNHDWSNLDGVCASGCGEICEHSYGEGVLTRPVRVTATEWDDGYYTYTCSLCGHYYRETVNRADYSALDAVLDDFIDAMYDATLLDSIRAELEEIYFDNIDVMYGDYIETEQAEVDALVETMTQKLAEIEQGKEDGSAIKPDYTEGDALINGIIEQFYDKGITYVDEIIAEFDTLYNEYLAIWHKPETTKPQVDEIVVELKALKEKIDKGTEDGTLIKADYTSIDNDIYELEYKLENKMITDEGKSGFEEIKKQLNEMKADENTSKADLAELKKALREYEAEIDKGIEDGTLVKFDGEKVFSEYENEVGELLIEKYGADFFHNFINEVLGEKFNTEHDKIYSDACTLTGGTMAENAENIAQIKASVDEFYGKVVNCIEGVHNGFVYEVTEEAKCGVNAIESATCTLCGETDEREIEGTALEHIFLDYVSNGDATCTADGTKTAFCIHGCGTTDTVADEGSMLDHTDEDGDKLCDDCGSEAYDRCDICGGKAHGDDKIQLLFCMIITIIRFVTSILKSIN